MSRHSRIAATPETELFTRQSYLFQRLRGLGPQIAFDAIQVARVWRLGLVWDDVRAQLPDPDHVSTAEVMRAVLTAFGTKHRVDCVVEKTPLHIRHVDDICRAIPEARFIWIQRDPRASIASLLKLEWASDSAETLSWQYLRNTGLGLRFSRMFPDRFHMVKYEDLATNPARVVAAINEWMGLDYEPAQMDHEVDTGTVAEFERSWKENVYKPVMADRASAWREELTAEQIAIITRITGPRMRRFGYDTGSDDPIGDQRPRLIKRMRIGVRRAIYDRDITARLWRSLYDATQHAAILWKLLLPRG